MGAQNRFLRTFDETANDYHPIGYDRRRLSLRPDGTIGIGQARMEQLWGLRSVGNTDVMEIYGDEGITARLNPGPNRLVWGGRWLVYECIPVEIRVVRTAKESLETGIELGFFRTLDEVKRFTFALAH